MQFPVYIVRLLARTRIMHFFELHVVVVARAAMKVS